MISRRKRCLLENIRTEPESEGETGVESMPRSKREAFYCWGTTSTRDGSASGMTSFS
jgi:hypothetical protein